MVKRDIPLNQGCLEPITVILPKNSILDPSDDAAVVGGNVLTSQRVTDVILTAFGAVACSQGCMNNFTFGDETMGYYETIAGCEKKNFSCPNGPKSKTFACDQRSRGWANLARTRCCPSPHDQHSYHRC